MVDPTQAKALKASSSSLCEILYMCLNGPNFYQSLGQRT